tara:strand:- start:6222 stop:8186 length:1965 start_codon:yes stop_codon:yes gene_type:complete
MTISRNLATFAQKVPNDGEAVVGFITVTVANEGSGNKYYFDGTSQQTVSLAKGVTYRFDTSDSSMSGHPLRFSTTSNGTHGGGSQFTTGITTNGDAGSAGSYVEVQLEQDAPDHLYSYCQYHSGMGGLVKTAPIGDANFASFANTFTFPTSDGSADQVIKTDGSGTLSFTDVSSGGGGGSLTATASGTLANGDKIIVNSNGTVSKVGAVTTSQSASIGTAVQWNDGNANNVTAVFDPDNSKVIVCFVESSKSKVVVGEVSGTSISFGSEVTFYDANSSHASIVYDTANNKVVIAYVNDDTYGAAIVGTVSGSSVSFGSEAIWLSSRADDIEAVYDSAAGAVVIVFTDFDNSYHCKAIAATVSGTTLTFGSVLTINAASSTYNRIGYDSTNSKSVVAFRHSGGKAAVVSCSGTTLSVGSVATFNSNNGSYPMDVVHDSNSGKTVIFYHDQQNSYYGYGIVGTVSGTGITFGTAVQLDDTASYRIGAVYDDDAQKILVAYTDGNDSKKGYYRLATVSGTSISFGSEAAFHSDGEVQTGYYTVATAFDSTNNVVVLAYRGRDSSNALDGYARVIQNAASLSTTNLTATNFIGIADAAYSDGATATIQIAGSVDDAQSSLTAGQLYYVQTDGTLSTSADSPSVIAGTAVSATKIIVKG